MLDKFLRFGPRSRRPQQALAWHRRDIRTPATDELARHQRNTTPASTNMPATLTPPLPAPTITTSSSLVSTSSPSVPESVR